MTLIPGGYARLVRGNKAPLAFGFLHAFLSAPGQTFYIALFVGSFAASLEVSEASLGTLYLAATLGSAMMLPLVGHWIDRLDLRLFAGVATAALGLACLITGTATSIVMLGVGIMLLRLTGQGLMVHVEAAATARYFGPNRGKALGLTALGLPLAEAVLPLVVAAVILAWGWREAYLGAGILILLVMLPLSQLLLAHRPSYTSPFANGQSGFGASASAGITILARSRFFWIALATLLYAPFTSTALLFHIGTIGAAKGWTLTTVAEGFVAFAVCHAVSLFVFGPLVDRLSARAMLPWMLVPMIAGMVILALSDDWLALVIFLGGAGATSGATKTVTSALWAEVYGPHVVGSVRSAAMALMVAATASGPAVLGLGLAAGLSIEAMVLATAAAGAIAIAPLVLVLRGHPSAGRPPVDDGPTAAIAQK